LSGNPSTVSDLWSKFAEDRQAPGSAAWMFAPDHPRLRKRIYDTYLDGLDPFTWVRNRLARLPARHGLEIGCGGGDLAIAIVETGMCERLDAFDVAAGAIDAARAKAAAKGIDAIRFSVMDGNAVRLPRARYDFVCASHALHHIENLENLFAQVAASLTPDGLFFADDFIGPSRMQYSDAHIALMNDLLACLPEHKRRSRFADGAVKSRVERVPIETFLRIDPSEGVRAADIVPLMRRHFDVEVFPTGMSLMYEVLIGIIHNFSEDNPADDAILDLVFLADRLCAEARLVEPCFACLVARPK
jgi:SAM-dependent methyltransferase